MITKRYLSLVYFFKKTAKIFFVRGIYTGRTWDNKVHLLNSNLKENDV